METGRSIIMVRESYNYGYMGYVVLGRGEGGEGDEEIKAMIGEVKRTDQL